MTYGIWIIANTEKVVITLQLQNHLQAWGKNVAVFPYFSFCMFWKLLKIETKFKVFLFSLSFTKCWVSWLDNLYVWRLFEINIQESEF